MHHQSMTPPPSPCYMDLVSYVLDHDNYDPEREVLVDPLDPRKSVTLQHARHSVRKLVGGLHRSGLQQDDTVCIHMFNDTIYPVLFLGIIGAGGRFTGSNPSYTATELGHHFKTSQTRFVITRRAHLDAVQKAALPNHIPKRNIIVLDGLEDSDAQEYTSMEDFLNGEEKPWRVFNDSETSRSTTAALLSTSGTTGLPKMAARSHLSWVAENQAIEDVQEKPYQVRRLLCVPFFHAFAAPLALISALRSGHVTYVMSRFNHKDFLGAIERFHITETAMPPPLIVRFLGVDPAEITMLKSIELIWCGGAPLSGSTQEAAIQMFAPSARICQVYGMTEGGWMSTFHYPEVDRTGSVGRLIGTYEAKIEKQDGACIVNHGSVGEVLLRGPIAMSGYLNNEKATQAAFDRDGWLRTGDVGFFSEEGKMYIIDRKKELIKVRGWQVAPAELESCLLSHPDIIDAAVIGIPHPWEATEIPRAFLVRRGGSNVSSEEVLTFLLQYLSKYKVMDCQIRFCDSIPKSSSGKILKKTLREAGSDSGYESVTSPGSEA